MTKRKKDLFIQGKERDQFDEIDEKFAARDNYNLFFSQNYKKFFYKDGQNQVNRNLQKVYEPMLERELNRFRREKDQDLNAPFTKDDCTEFYDVFVRISGQIPSPYEPPIDVKQFKKIKELFHISEEYKEVSRE